MSQESTNLNAGSGPTSKPVQGPHSRLVFRLARWPSNWLYGGPRTVTQKGSILQNETFLIFLWALNWLSGRGSSGPAGGCPAYMNICCRVETWSKIWGFLSQNLVQGCVKTWSKICFCLFSPQFYSVFWLS